MVEGSDTRGVFEFRPLEPGFGITIGNALRRILLSSLEGFAISSIRIDGVTHEFDSIDGVIEDVADMVLNFKQVRLKQIVPTEFQEKVSFTISGQEQFKAGDIIGVREKSKSLEVITNSLEGRGGSSFAWLEWDNDKMCGKFMNYPAREEIPENINEQLIVELYSK